MSEIQSPPTQIKAKDYINKVLDLDTIIKSDTLQSIELPYSNLTAPTPNIA